MADTPAPGDRSDRRLRDRAADRADAGQARRGAARRAATSSSSRSGTASARSSSAATATSSSRAATCGRSTATSPSCTTLLLAALPDGCVVDGEIVIAGAARARLRRAAAAAASGRVARRQARRGDAGVVRRLRSAGASTAQDLRELPQSERRAPARDGCSADAAPPLHLTPMTRDRALAAEWLARFEGAGLDGVIAKPVDGDLPAGQARDDQDQARAHRRLRGRRLPLAQERATTLVGSLLLGLYDDAGALQHVGVTSSFTMAVRKAAGRGAGAAARGRARRPSVARLGRGAGRVDQRMPGGAEPLERRQGSVVGAAAHRARLRGEVRPPAGRPLPPRRRCSCAGGPTSRRPTAATTSSRSRRLTSSRRSSAPVSRRDSLLPVLGQRILVRDRAAPAAAAASSGTCCRLTRMRVHVWKRPRIASTSTSAGCEVRRRLRDGAPSSARARRARRPWRARGRSRSAAMLGDAGRLAAARAGAGVVAARLATAPRAAARPPACGSAAATARRRGPRARARAESSSSASSEHGALVDAGVRDRRPRRSAPASSRSVKSRGSQASSSSHVSGAETRASGFGRTE